MPNVYKRTWFKYRRNKNKLARSLRLARPVNQLNVRSRRRTKVNIARRKIWMVACATLTDHRLLVKACVHRINDRHLAYIDMLLPFFKTIYTIYHHYFPCSSNRSKHLLTCVHPWNVLGTSEPPFVSIRLPMSIDRFRWPVQLQAIKLFVAKTFIPQDISYIISIGNELSWPKLWNSLAELHRICNQQ